VLCERGRAHAAGHHAPHEREREMHEREREREPCQREREHRTFEREREIGGR
jgi:hypothetical protein